MDKSQHKIIDPVECALAVIGIQSVISREVEKVLVADVKAMADLNDNVYKEARNIINGESSSVPLTSVPYKKMLIDLTEDFDAGQLEEMVNKFPAALHEISAPFLIKAKQTVKLLAQMFPRSQKTTLLGPENILPSALAIRKFATILDVIEDPMRVLAHISCGSLLKAQVTVVKEIFPSFSECLDDALAVAGENAKVAKKSFVLPAKVTIGYGTWKGLPRVNQNLANKLQDNFKQAQQQQNKPPGQEATETSVAAKEAMTGTQKALYPNLQKAG